MKPKVPKESAAFTRRKLLRSAGFTAAAGGAGVLLGSNEASGDEMTHARMGHGIKPGNEDSAATEAMIASHEGPTFRGGETVDDAANGFDPTAILRDFDWGRTSRLPDGQILREWEVNAIDKEIEVAPGVHFPAWPYDGRIPGPTLRAREGERLRIHFGNGSQHPHTMHFHGIHTAAMDGVPGIGACLIEPG